MRVIYWLLPALALACIGPAAANTRDDVMSAAFQCNRIADTRAWLDCYYGAAQPMRAQLRLPPAPENQTRLVSSPPPGGAPKDAPLRNGVMTAAVRCNGVADDRRWLDCYYGASQPVRLEMGLSALAVSPVPLSNGRPDAILANPPIDGGKGRQQEDARHLPDQLGSKNASRLVSPLASYTFDKAGIFTVTLANGQTWQQLSGDTTYAHWKKPAAAYIAVVTHGAFGSYNFQIQKLPGVYKVARID